ncbi:MAG: hypothetical protein VB091_07480 [Christensenella sp.]|nr:hypothetical protein [Christensenella sp.]
MLLLFTSGTYPRYKRDVLDVVNLPENALIKLQYSFIKDDEETSSAKGKEKSKDIGKDNENKDKDKGEEKPYSYVEKDSFPKNCKANEEVIFFFINRDDPENFKYIPIRKGRFISGYESANVAYYTIELGIVCAASDPNNFQKSLNKKVGRLLYEKHDGENRSGYYAFRTESDLSKLIDISPKHWKTTTELIAECKCFKDVFAVFTRFNLYQGDQDKPVLMSSGKNEHCFYVHYGSYYTAKIDYIAPGVRRDSKMSSTAKISIMPECFEGTSPIMKFDAGLGMVEYRFRVTGVSKNLELSYTDLTEKDSNGESYIADNPIPMRAVRTKWRWVLILGVLGLMLLCDVLNQFPIEDTITRLNAELPGNLSLIQHWQLSLAYLLRATEALYPALISSIKSWLTLLMVLLYGKKEL